MYKSFAIVIALLISLSSVAQNLQSPSQFLGYDLGTKFSRHHQVIDYFKHVAEAKSQQVKLESYGETNERRPLMLAYVSSEENLKNLETIRENNLKNAGVLNGKPTANTIAIVWLSYNVHGNEASSTEASMRTIYKLLTEKQAWLKNTVVIIDPCINPDGRDRYVNWYNETASVPYDIDQQASEHNEPWPGGRPNHYLFDLNRDWAWATQVESSSRLKAYNKWLPHIHVDFHEQGINEPYYFAPAAEPFHEIISDWQRDFQTQIGKNHATYFDKEGWLYFTRERFDLLYPSYGDTYPTYMGAIGMTYEQAGHGRAGLGILNDEGDVLTLVDRLTHHTTTGLSTVEISSKNAEKLNTEFAKFFNNSGLKYKSYVLKGDTDKINSLMTLLDKHEISYGYAQGGKVSGYNYATSKDGQLNASSNDLVVSTNQPKGKMVKVLFEPNAKLSDSLTYDITAWSIPYAYGLDAIASKTLIPTNTNKLKSIPRSISNSGAAGYVVSWNSMKDAQFLADVLKGGFKVRFTEKPFTTQGKTYERGSLIITRGDNKMVEDFDDKLVDIAFSHQRTLNAVSSGFSTSGPDFGSPDIKLVNPPKIALLSGDYTSSYSYGELWHFFEQQLGYPVTSINTNNLSNTNLSKYNVLIMPNGYYGSFLNDAISEKLKNWVSAGGKLIAIDGALNSFADKEGFGLKRNTPEESTQDKEDNRRIKYADRERDYTKNLITGAIFKSDVDNTHPMAFGYSDNYFTLKLGSSSYSLLDNGYNVAYLGDNPKNVSGYAGRDALKKLDNSLIFGEQRLGSGSLIYMVDNIMFRSFWENGKLFLVNSIFFVNNNLHEL
ncbi:M14 metallopeptidase family protein [Psychroserpens algicola]|uniref:M14 metallopeptidase family protein n=1 Tax=Psychroserpens algicola TaxID=1719034 RepID=UPI001952EDB3|nr:M14 metallopeptidase family protein [Psychroserpens algicola]